MTGGMRGGAGTAACTGKDAGGVAGDCTGAGATGGNVGLPNAGGLSRSAGEANSPRRRSARAVSAAAGAAGTAVPAAGAPGGGAGSATGGLAASRPGGGGTASAASRRRSLAWPPPTRGSSRRTGIGLERVGAAVWAGPGAATGAATGATTSTGAGSVRCVASRPPPAWRHCAAAAATGWRLVITVAGTTVTAFGRFRFWNSLGPCGLLMTFVIWMTFVTFVMLMFCV